ncbi:MAG: hypothetical protein HRU19_28885 [Pseudobacteriovorax sp.]|nr:hypothetical protein [Pseudobacteriovorax sp.]
MKKSEYFAKVARKADTANQKLNAADVSRMLRVEGDLLGKMNSVEYTDTMAKWLPKKKK